MASALASRLDKLEAEITPLSQYHLIGSFVSEEEMAARRNGPNVLAQGDC